MQRPLLYAKQQFMNCGNTESCHVSAEEEEGNCPYSHSEEAGTAETPETPWGHSQGHSQGHSLHCRVLQDTSTPWRPPAAAALTKRDRNLPQKLCLSLLGPSGQGQEGSRLGTSTATSHSLTQMGQDSRARSCSIRSESGTSTQPQAELMAEQLHLQLLLT